MSALAVLAAAATAFLLSSAYYSVFGTRLATVSAAAAAGGQPPPWKIAVELLRCLTLAVVLAWLAARGDVDGLAGGLVLGLVLWLGFPAVLWTGALIWEETPVALAAIHAGDWLVKLLVLAAIVSAWP
jgi:hypothetical protein